MDSFLLSRVVFLSLGGQCDSTYNIIGVYSSCNGKIWLLSFLSGHTALTRREHGMLYTCCMMDGWIYLFYIFYPGQTHNVILLASTAEYLLFGYVLPAAFLCGYSHEVLE